METSLVPSFHIQHSTISTSEVESMFFSLFPPLNLYSHRLCGFLQPTNIISSLQHYQSFTQLLGLLNCLGLFE